MTAPGVAAPKAQRSGLPENLLKYLFSACLMGTVMPTNIVARFVGGYA
jgi:hypothetical protein